MKRPAKLGWSTLICTHFGTPSSLYTRGADERALHLREWEEILEMLRKEFAMNEIREGIHRHYKGNLYRVLCVAKHSETLEEMVVYQDAIDEDKFWARPLAMWNGEVDAGGKKLPRFQFLSPSMGELDEKPIFRLIEAIKDNLEQYQHLGEYTCATITSRRATSWKSTKGFWTWWKTARTRAIIRQIVWQTPGRCWNIGRKYLRLPNDDVNAYDQMERFIYDLPIRYQDELERVIRGRGAFRRFKDTAARLGVLNEWYRYLEAAYRREARMWCQANGIA